MNNQFEYIESSNYFGDDRKYKKLGVLCFSEKTPDALCRELLRLHETRAKVKIIYGDQETGKHWLEESDVYGTIGRSTGQYKIPLLVPKCTSYGGAALLDDCILRIESEGRLCWQNPNMTIPEYEITKSDLPEYAENLVIDGEIHARFRKLGGAKRLVKKLGLDLPSIVDGKWRQI